MVLFVQWNLRIVEWVCIMFIGWAYYWSFTCNNMSLLSIAKHKAGQWMPLGHAFFGVGALTVPQIIRLLDLDTYLYLCPLYLISAGVAMYVPTPKDDND